MRRRMLTFSGCWRWWAPLCNPCWRTSSDSFPEFSHHFPHRQDLPVELKCVLINIVIIHHWCMGDATSALSNPLFNFKCCKIVANHSHHFDGDQKERRYRLCNYKTSNVLQLYILILFVFLDMNKCIVTVSSLLLNERVQTFAFCWWASGLVLLTRLDTAKRTILTETQHKIQKNVHRFTTPPPLPTIVADTCFNVIVVRALYLAGYVVHNATFHAALHKFRPRKTLIITCVPLGQLATHNSCDNLYLNRYWGTERSRLAAQVVSRGGANAT